MSFFSFLSKRTLFTQKVIFSYLIFIFLIFIFNQNNSDRLSSFLIVFFAAIISILFISRGSVNNYGFSILKYLTFGFLLKVFVGYLFWQFYLFPEYFASPNSRFYFDHSEFLYTESWMRQIADYRINYGLFSFEKGFFYRKSSLIHYFLSNIYLSGSYNPLDLSIQNSLFSIYTSIIIAQIVKISGGSSQQIKFALILTILQPFSCISTMIWRDVAGQFLIALGGYFLLKSLNKNFFYSFILVLIATMLMFSQRYIYIIFPIVTYGGYFVLSKKRSYALFFLPIAYFLVMFLNDLLQLSNHLSVSYGSGISSFSYWIYLPINILRVFIGPFPWINWFDFNDSTIFSISDYFQAVMNFSLVIMAFKLLNKRIRILKTSVFKSLHKVDVIFILLFTLFVVSATGVLEVHVAYLSTGSIFLIPTISLLYKKENFLFLFYKFLYLFLIFNFFYVLFNFSGNGLGNFLR